MGFITDCPTEYAIWQQEQAHLAELAEEHERDCLEQAKQEMNQILEVLGRIPHYKEANDLNQTIKDECVLAGEYIKTIRNICAGGEQQIIVQSVLTPIVNGLVDSEYNLEAVIQLLEHKPDKPTHTTTKKGE